jgi:hypothetical protein
MSAAACVSLSNSTMSKTMTNSRQPHCFAPVVGDDIDSIPGIYIQDQY